MRLLFVLVLASTLFLVSGCINTDTGLQIPAVNQTSPDFAQARGEAAERVDLVPNQPIDNGNTGGVDLDAVAEEGDTVYVDYIGSFEDTGKLFDTSIKEEAEKAGLPPRPSYDPLEVVVGAGSLIQGFDNALFGMKVGDFQTIVLSPDLAYGETNPDLIQTIAWEDFGADSKDFEVGQTVQTQRGPAVVNAVDDDAITLNFNHALAGKTLVFRITMTRIVKKTAE